MKIQVIQDDINNGERCSHTHCPIARATRRAMNNGSWASVDYSYIYIYAPGKKTKIYPTSRRMKRFINKVDNFELVKPQAFIIKGL